MKIKPAELCSNINKKESSMMVWKFSVSKGFPDYMELLLVALPGIRLTEY